MINLTKGRTEFQAIGNTYPVAGNIRREDLDIANTPCSWFLPEGAAADNIAIYIHGGAFIFGSVASHAPMVSYIARELNRRVLVIDYRLAPEHPFPAGLTDCVEVIKAVCAHNPDVGFGIIGDSAGGNLSMAVNLVLQQTNGPKPRYTIVISPWADLECKNESYTRNKLTDTILERAYLMEAARLYTSEPDLSIPLLSPVNADFNGLSPVLILVGTYEILEDDALNLHRQLTAHGVQAELQSFEQQLHVWPFMNIDTDASRDALKAMAKFALKHS